MKSYCKNILFTVFICFNLVFSLSIKADTSIVVCPVVVMDSLVISTINIICGGTCDTNLKVSVGNIKVTVFGGTGPYAFEWFPGTPPGDHTDSIFDLCANTYAVVVTDSGDLNNTCTAPFLPITAPPPLTGFISPPAPSTLCKGNCDGTAKINLFGGVQPYTYLWNNGETTPTAIALCPGTAYVIFTDANGCNDSVSTTIDEPPLIIDSVAGND